MKDRASPLVVEHSEPGKYPPYVAGKDAGRPPRALKTAPLATFDRNKDSGVASSSDESTGAAGKVGVRGVGVGASAPPPSGQASSRGTNTADLRHLVHRPMSFVKALEMSEVVDSQEQERERRKQQAQQRQQQHKQQQQQQNTAPKKEGNLYGSTYEISVWRPPVWVVNDIPDKSAFPEGHCALSWQCDASSDVFPHYR